MQPVTARQEAITLLCLLASALFLWALAYQLPLAQTIHVGGEVALQRREDDALFLSGVNGSEPADRIPEPADPRGYIWWWEQLQRTGGRPYRWTTAESSLRIPGAGGGLFLVEVSASGGRPDSLATASSWVAGTAAPLALSLPAGDSRRYRLLVAADASGDLRLTMRTTPYAAPGDPRELGFALHEVRLRALGGAPRAPAWPTLGWLGLAVATTYGLASALRAGRPVALALAGGGALAAGLCLAFARPAITVFAPALGLLALACVAIAAVAWPFVRAVVGRQSSVAARLSAVVTDEAAQVLGMVLLAFALRMGGMLHPQALFSDLGLHANNLFEVSLGRVFFSEGLPSDAGGGRAPYPPGGYLMLLPGQLLAVGGEARRLLVQGGTALLDSLAVALIWALLRRAGLGRAGAALGAACYLLPTPALEAFSIGEYANLAGQALALPLLALLGAGLVSSRRPTTDDRRPPAQGSSIAGYRPSAIALLVAAVALALLAHSGVTLSVGALVGSAWALALAGRLRGRAGPVDPILLTLGAAAGLAVAVLIYYSAPQFLALFAERGGRGGGQGASLPEVLASTARALLGLAPPQDTRVALPPLIGPLGLCGLALALRSTAPQLAPLRALLAAWWLGTLLTLALLVVAGQGVRWAIFLYPALCLGAGLLLDALWRRGLIGRLAAALALAAIVAAGVATWVVTIRDFIHV